jgi:hypothetical protein
MQQAMNDADHYLNVEQWLNTVISLDGRTVEQELEHAAPKIDKAREVELKDKIQRFERAVSVLTGSNPDWRTKVSKGDKELIEGLVGTMWKGWVSDEWL